MVLNTVFGLRYFIFISEQTELLLSIVLYARFARLFTRLRIYLLIDRQDILLVN